MQLEFNMEASPNKIEKIKLDFKDSKYATGRRKTSIAKIWFKKIFSCCLSDKRQSKDKLFRMYIDGEERIEKEFDIVNIVQNMRHLTILLKQ